MTRAALLIGPGSFDSNSFTKLGCFLLVYVHSVLSRPFLLVSLEVWAPFPCTQSCSSVLTRVDLSSSRSEATRRLLKILVE